ncbi:MAG: hypothetical protein E7260_11200 [Lachnospiraceae bacterium]|nr:hypothetical protein [Lachnospiraceae bacterium]
MSDVKKSMVQVHFWGSDMALSYYNDRFDLHVGDKVYVEGRWEGCLGHVVAVNYNFRIKVSDYKRVIAVVDTNVTGHFLMAGTHFVTFDREAIPSSKVARWFLAPVNEEEEIVCGYDESSFPLDNLDGMKASPAIVVRGTNYYKQQRVVYLCIDSNKGYAIVEGSEAYEVEFEYRNGEISHLVCSCMCNYPCKHEVAAMLQLRAILEKIENQVIESEHMDYFAAINKEKMFSLVIDGKEEGQMIL